jgi:translation initiation factor IF-2
MGSPGGPGRGPGGPGGPRTGPGAGRSSGGPGSLTRGLRLDSGRPEEPLFGADRTARRRDTGKKDKEKDRDTSIRDFIETGLGTGLKEEFHTRRAPGAAPPKPAGKATPKRKPDESRRIKPSQLFHEMGDDPMRERRRGRRPGHTEQRGSTDQRERVIEVYGALTVGEFAKRLGVQAAEVIKRLFLLGEVITINQAIEPGMMELIGGELGAKVIVHQESDEHDIAKYTDDAEDNPEDIVPRAPVVTVMGHVDHGKTTLLDYIRKSNVAAGEAGGMTQHIGAYEVNTSKGRIVFLDTPGHAAFTEMRARGAKVTDIVLLVVAADDGVMPQTIEAIDHAKAAEVPIIVAINKIDSPGANPARVKQELMRHGLVPEELGGDTIMQPVSALKGTNMDALLEMIALQSEVLELKANPNRAAEGTVVESRIDPLRGATVTVLVERGTLRIGDVFLCGVETGRVRALRNSVGANVEAAGPSTPVEVLGITGSPAPGEHFMVLPDEGTARDIADDRLRRRRAKEVTAKPHITLENLAQHIAESETKTLNLIIKADVQGSVEALRGSLAKIKSSKVQLNIIRAAVGGISASDVSLADASDAVIIGFNVRPDTEATTSAERLGVSIRTYDIIFNLVEDVEKAMIGLLDPVMEEKDEGRAYVQAVFKISKVGTIAGCKVENGTIERSHSARLVRDGVVIWNGKISSLKRHKDDAKSVATGFECGIGLAGYNDVKVGDYIETYSTVKKEASLLTEA